jgi:hypothetical protein
MKQLIKALFTPRREIKTHRVLFDEWVIKKIEKLEQEVEQLKNKT